MTAITARTTELEKRMRSLKTIYGGIHYERATWSVGATVATADFGRRLLRDVKLQQFEFQVTQHPSASIEPLAPQPHWFGEAAPARTADWACSPARCSLDKRCRFHCCTVTISGTTRAL